MPKSKKKNSASEVFEETQPRVPASERREEEFNFNCYSKKRVKVTMVVEAMEEIKNIRQKRRKN